MAMTLTPPATPSGGFKVYQTITYTVAGGANNTTYTAVIGDGAGHNKNVVFTTNGSGAGSFSFVASHGGSQVINVYLAVPVSQANTTLQVGGSG